MDRRNVWARSNLAGPTFAAALLLVSACSVDPVLTERPPRPNTTDVFPTASPTAITAPTMAPSNVSFTVVPSKGTVRAGETIDFEATLANLGEPSIIYETDGCFAELDIIPIIGPGAGRSWSGRAGAFKIFALQQNFPPDQVGANEPLLESVDSRDCPRPRENRSWLLGGQSVTAHFRWEGNSYDGLPVRPGDLRYRASVAVFRFDRVVPGQNFTGLTADGALAVTGSKPGYISAAEAIDAALSDKRFRGFVEAQPEGTCETVNVGLSNWQPGAFLPPGPNWDVELLCQTHVRRHYAMIAIDPVTADARGYFVCPRPCWR